MSNDFTIRSSTNIPNVTDLLTGKLTGSPWTNLIFGLSAWQGQQVTLSIEYVTDPAVGGFGIAIDDINLLSGSGNSSINDFETALTQTVGDGFISFARISEYKDAAPEYYYIQVRSNEKLDAGLIGENYDPGVLLWYRNDAFTNNNSSEHPGQGFISVIDADQNRLGFGNTQRQIRDAAFSLYTQTPPSGDSHLTANSQFSDGTDYSAPEQPQSGTKLPLWGIEFSIVEQHAKSHNATISLSRKAIELSTNIASTREGLRVNFTHNSISSYPIVKTSWDFGDGGTSLLATPSHEYETGGQYQVNLSIEDSTGAKFDSTHTVTVGEQIVLEASLEQNNTDIYTVSFASVVSGGAPPFIYQWDFGDDNTSNERVISHVYNSTGNYDVVLNVTDSIGQKVTKELEVTIKSALNSDFTYTAANEVVTFTSQIKNPSGELTINWNFGDGQASSEQSPTHVYANSGSYTVTLTVSDATGTTNTITKQVVVSGASNIQSTDEGSSSGGAFGFAFFVVGLVGLLGRRYRQ